MKKLIPVVLIIAVVALSACVADQAQDSQDAGSSITSQPTTIVEQTVSDSEFDKVVEDVGEDFIPEDESIDIGEMI